MNYENAGDLLPEELLKEVKKYAAGKLLYVPLDQEKKAWGEASGYRQVLVRRNQIIYNKYLHGTSISELSKEYYLSQETVKRIVYSKKDTNKLDYYPTAQSAAAYSEAGMLEEWIHTYLLFGRRNQAFSEGLRLMCRIYEGPHWLPLDLFKQTSGPGRGMKWQVDQGDFEQKVMHCSKQIQRGEEPPPLIANYVQGTMELNSGNPLLEALHREGVSKYPVIVWMTEAEDYEQYLRHYAEYRTM